MFPAAAKNLQCGFFIKVAERTADISFLMLLWSRLYYLFSDSTSYGVGFKHLKLIPIIIFSLKYIFRIHRPILYIFLSMGELKFFSYFILWNMKIWYYRKNFTMRRNFLFWSLATLVLIWYQESIFCNFLL